jgi:hypothetical protein
MFAITTFLSQGLLHGLGHRPAHGVGQTPRWKGHDHEYRPGGIVLRGSARYADEREDKDSQQPFHTILLDPVKGLKPASRIGETGPFLQLPENIAANGPQLRINPG